MNHSTLGEFYCTITQLTNLRCVISHSVNCAPDTNGISNSNQHTQWYTLLITYNKGQSNLQECKTLTWHFPQKSTLSYFLEVPILACCRCTRARTGSVQWWEELWNSFQAQDEGNIPAADHPFRFVSAKQKQLFVKCHQLMKNIKQCLINSSIYIFKPPFEPFSRKTESAKLIWCQRGGY